MVVRIFMLISVAALAALSLQDVMAQSACPNGRLLLIKSVGPVSKWAAVTWIVI